jgi:tetratricopeptide (TPR) repeat protein
VTKHDFPVVQHALYRKYEGLGDSGSDLSRIGFAGEAFKKATKRKEEHYHAMAMELQRNGEYREAVKAFMQAITYEPTHLASHLDLGLLLSKLGKHAAAKTCYSHVVRLDSTCITGMVALTTSRHAFRTLRLQVFKQA